MPGQSMLCGRAHVVHPRCSCRIAGFFISAPIPPEYGRFRRTDNGLYPLAAPSSHLVCSLAGRADILSVPENDFSVHDSCHFRFMRLNVFIRSKGILQKLSCRSAAAVRAEFAQLFRLSVVCTGEHAACRHRRRAGRRVPYPSRRRGRENKGNRPCPRRL